MDVRFALIPAGSAESAAAAQGIARAMQTDPEHPPPAVIAEVLGALDGSPVGHYMLECRTVSRDSLLEVADPEAGLLEALLILAKDHDLAVYDIGLNRLYDPAGSVDVDVVLPGVRLPFLTRDLLEDLVRRPVWPDPEAPYLIVDRAEQDFIQTWLTDDGTYQLEYREGGPESHFVVHTDDAALVTNVMWAWTIQDPGWRTAVDWMFVDLDAPADETGETDRVRADPSIPKHVSRSASLQNDHRPDGSRLTLRAELDSDGALRILGQDLGPVTHMMSDDGEYEWGYTVAAENVPALLIALGGEPANDVIDLLEQRWSGGNVGGLESTIRASGVPYEFWSYP